MKRKEINKALACAVITAALVMPSPLAGIFNEKADAETVTEPVVIEEVVEAVNTCNTYYNVPLSHSMQDWIINNAAEYGVNPAIIVAMIETESRFTADAVSEDGTCYGLMQINPRWHMARMQRLGVPDLTEPFGNVLVGIDIIAEKLGEYNGDYAAALMAYNGGNQYANEMLQSGHFSTYAVTIIERAKELENGNY